MPRVTALEKDSLIPIVVVTEVSIVIPAEINLISTPALAEAPKLTENYLFHSDVSVYSV